MKLKIRSILIFSVLILFAFSMTAADTLKVRTVGNAPLLGLKRGQTINSVEELKVLVEKYSSRIEQGLQNVGAGFLYQPIMDAIANGKVKEKEIAVGTNLEWMLFYSGRKVRDKANLEWAGKAPLAVFCVPVQKDCKDYRVIIPKACGNITLATVKDSKPVCGIVVSPAIVNPGAPLKVDVSSAKCAPVSEVSVFFEGKKIETKKITSDNPVWETNFKNPGNYKMTVRVQGVDGEFTASDCSAEITVNYPPVCDLKVTPEKGMVGKTITFDASGSTDKDGKITKAEIAIYNKKDGTEIDKKIIDTPPFVWEKKFKKAGEYNVTLKVTDDHGAVSANNCEFGLRVEKNLYLLVEGGPGVAKGTYTTVAFARVGVQYFIVPQKFSVIASLGGGFVLSGEPFVHHFLSNLLVNGHFDSFFVGAGVGFSSKVREATLKDGVLLAEWNSDFDLVFNLGLDILETAAGKGSIFGELRVPIKEGYTFEHYHEILLGFRYIF